MAGVCLFRFDPADNSYAYKIEYFDGVAAGHSVSVNPNGTVGFLGNAGQHLLFYDAQISMSRAHLDPPLRGSRDIPSGKHPPGLARDVRS